MPRRGLLTVSSNQHLSVAGNFRSDAGGETRPQEPVIGRLRREFPDGAQVRPASEGCHTRIRSVNAACW